MDLNSRIFDRIRVRREAKEEEAGPGQPRCDFPGCAAAGLHRAPMGRLREGQYFCFCLDHVREYNAGYNYFTGMSAEDVALYQRDALTGHRPTWTMGALRGGRSFRADDGFDPAGEGPRFRAARSQPERPRLGAAALRALDTLGLDEGADADAVKARYKDLVKRLHPDANGGDRSNEDRLREIIRAYKYLSSARLR
ncbi:J domain-containing protein [Methylocella sp.]|uniref:J domain-containing protein n=1 Tax=Methylocella sp. TaxID=1978226 RepID=UPI0035B42D75